MPDKKFKPHMMYGEGQEEMADTYQEHLDLENKGWGHNSPDSPAPFKMNGFSEHATAAPLKAKKKGRDGKACWKGYALRGTKKKGGKIVDNCVKIKKRK